MVFWQNGKQYGGFMQPDMVDRSLRTNEGKLKGISTELSRQYANFDLEYKRIRKDFDSQDYIAAYLDAVILARKSHTFCSSYMRDVYAIFEDIKTYNLDVFSKMDVFKPFMEFLTCILRLEVFAITSVVKVRALGSKDVFDEIQDFSSSFANMTGKFLELESRFQKQAKKNRTNTMQSRLDFEYFDNNRKILESIHKNAVMVHKLSRKRNLSLKEIEKVKL